ncbi:hypothetical protein L2E82_30122 [Cichorium intybus]|uniref:Uncharacterized protein n=1 Tax=Cichorium intybus TaxID=13427 RepID=A0ACB9CZN1_CICIN|nr:hypothetical protein L2E82_30122 [Cichorium intybus]
MKKILLKISDDVDKDLQTISWDRHHMEDVRQLVESRRNWIQTKKKQEITGAEAENRIRTNKGKIEREKCKIWLSLQELNEKKAWVAEQKKYSYEFAEWQVKD